MDTVSPGPRTPFHRRMPIDRTVSASPAAAASRTPAMYPIDDFYRNTQFRGAAWSPRRDRILVSSDASGIWNAYAVPVAGGPPVPFTALTTNSIFALSYFPADERFLYSSDEGGNELTHIFVQNSGWSTRDLMLGAKLKANFHGWAGDDRSLLVSTNERDPRYFDLNRDRGRRVRSNYTVQEQRRLPARIDLPGQALHRAGEVEDDIRQRYLSP